MMILSVNTETIAWIISVSLNGKTCQRHQINSIAVFQHIKIIIAGRQPDNIGYAGFMPGSRTHPYHIMIPPLEIHVLQLHQMIHDNMRPRSSVENIPDHMKSCDNQTLNSLGNSHNKLFGPVDSDDSIKNLIIILLFLHHPVILAEQFFQNVREIRRKTLS